MPKYQKIILISFSIICVAAIITCAIVNIVIDREFTWSLYPILSIPFGWLLFIPLIRKRHGIVLSICSLTLITIPYLFFLEKITPVGNWFIAIGIPCAIAGIITIWLLFLLYRFLKISTWYKVAVTIFLAGVITNPVINYYVDTFLYEKPRWLETIISAASCLILTIALFIIGRKRNKAKSTSTSVPESDTNV